MTPETLLLVLLGILVAVYALVAIVAYSRSHWTRLMVPGEADALLKRFDGGALSGASEPHPGGPSGGERSANRPAAGSSYRDDTLRRWFAGKSCAICSRPIPPVHRTDPRPGLMNASSQTHEIVSWDEVPADDGLPALLESQVPVCANCSLAETFRRKFPDLVTDRPGQRHEKQP